MPFVPVPGVVAVNIRATLFGKPIQTDLNFTADNFISNGQIEDLINPLLIRWTTEAIPLLPPAYLLQSIYGYDAGEQEGAAASANLEFPVPGTRLGLPLPANVSLFFNQRIGSRKRGNSGGIYWPCLMENDVTDNSVVSSIIADVIGLLSGLTGPGAVAPDFVLCAVSKFAGGLPRPTGVAREILDWVVNDIVVDSMRRRLPKRSS